MHILLSNDDGIRAEGLRTVREALTEARPDWKITTVAPAGEQSAMSHALTLSRPLRIDEVGERQYAIDGTPTDCVLMAVNSLLQEDRPDVVISGINHGPNMGEDVHYSGTVAAAFEGRLLGLPSFALSLASRSKPLDFRGARDFVSRVLPGWIEEGVAAGTLLNVNIPARAAEDILGIRPCPLGSRRYEDTIVRKEDPRGRAYYWLGGHAVEGVEDGESDMVRVREGWITVTPLHVDLTDYERLRSLGSVQTQEG